MTNPRGGEFYVRNSPVIFVSVRKWRSFCADTGLDTRLFDRGTSDVRILERSVLASVRQHATSMLPACISGGARITLGQDAHIGPGVSDVHEGAPA